MTWNWERLSAVVRRLKMPAGEYAVDRVGYGLSRDLASTAGRVELLVTETGWHRLKERGWREQGGARVLRHPHERHLRARVVALERVRHEVVEIDGVPVLAVEADLLPGREETWQQRLRTTITGVILTIVVGTIVYGFTVALPTPGPRAVWQHLTFGTTKVDANVETWDDLGTCPYADAYDDSSQIRLTLTWLEDGQTRTGFYTACDASVGSPQEIWLSKAGEVASQRSPWRDHLWPGLIVGIVPFLFFVWPVVERLRERRWRHRAHT